MIRRWAVAALIPALTLVSSLRAAPGPVAQREIDHLLGFVGNSGCEFYRNGSWYDSKRAQEHLRSKYQWLMVRDQIHTAEDFIEKAASRSSLSGRPYEVRCAGGGTVTNRQWLRDELKCYRNPSVGGCHAEPPPAGGGFR